MEQTLNSITNSRNITFNLGDNFKGYACGTLFENQIVKQIYKDGYVCGTTTCAIFQSENMYLPTENTPKPEFIVESKSMYRHLQIHHPYYFERYNVKVKPKTLWKIITKLQKLFGVKGNL